MTKKAQPRSIYEALKALTFIPDRRPETSDKAMQGAFCQLSEYRDGAIFVTHYAGNSSWERHPVGDEIVMVVEGETRLFIRHSDGVRENLIGKGDLIVIPQNLWHRFETPLPGAKILTVTPQPTDHSLENLP